MTKPQQSKFVRELSRNIANEIISKIHARKIPASWTGHELRMLLAEKHAASAHMSQLSNHPRGRQAREYRKTVLNNNL